MPGKTVRMDGPTAEKFSVIVKDDGGNVLCDEVVDAVLVVTRVNESHKSGSLLYSSGINGVDVAAMANAALAQILEMVREMDDAKMVNVFRLGIASGITSALNEDAEFLDKRSGADEPEARPSEPTSTLKTGCSGDGMNPSSWGFGGASNGRAR